MRVCDRPGCHHQERAEDLRQRHHGPYNSKTTTTSLFLDWQTSVSGPYSGPTGYLGAEEVKRGEGILEAVVC